MKKHHLLTLLTFALAMLVAVAAQAGGGHGHDGDSDSGSGSCSRIKVCHFPPNNPDNFHTITISSNKLARHQRHGDLLGSCQGNCEEICGDGNPCTQDTESNTNACICLPEPVPVSCDDGVSCTTDSCDPVDGSCNYTNTCEDNNQCTANICSSGECTFPPVSGCLFAPVVDGTECDDGDPGTIGDQCISGTCEGELDLCAGVTCDEPDQCQVAGTCTDGLCDYPDAPDGTTCDDGNPATDGDQCTGGICDGELDLCFEVTCDDGNSCTADSCDPANGACIHDPTGTDGNVCDDGDPTTDNDQCTSGTCAGDPDLCLGVVCDDGNSCTADSCDPADGSCINDASGTDGDVCDDGDSSTTGDQCNAGICEGEPSAGDCSSCTADSQIACGLFDAGVRIQSCYTCSGYYECGAALVPPTWVACPAGQVFDVGTQSCGATSGTCAYADGECSGGGPPIG